MPVTTCIFDAYGTLFDIAAAARQAAEEPGQEKLAEIWPRLAADWRSKQLEYSWLRAVGDAYVSFWQVTQDGLDWAMENAGLDDAELRERLLALYWELDAYPEVPDCLAAIAAQNQRAAVLSNGSSDMLNAAVQSAGLEDLLIASLSVEDVGIFKPARAVYDMVGARFGTDPRDVLFVSANGWDAAGAAAYGFHTVWVNRTGAPIDRLPGRPDHEVKDLTSVAALAARV
ncbi:MAG: haloacid dehalogenase type II [Pseudomonadota bacterium]